jgi:hypothetical protein
LFEQKLQHIKNQKAKRTVTYNSGNALGEEDVSIAANDPDDDEEESVAETKKPVAPVVDNTHSSDIAVSNLASSVEPASLTSPTRNATTARPDPEADSYVKQPLWLVGLSLVVFGSIADFTALSLGPQSLVAPLGSLTLVSNTIFAPLLLKEVHSQPAFFLLCLVVL